MLQTDRQTNRGKRTPEQHSMEGQQGEGFKAGVLGFPKQREAGNSLTFP